MPAASKVVDSRFQGKNPHHGVVRVGVVSTVTLCCYRFKRGDVLHATSSETELLLAASLALVLWAAIANRSRTGAEKAAQGLERGGGAIESRGKKLGEKIEHAGEGTKVENAAKATGSGIETAGEKFTKGPPSLATRRRKLPPPSARPSTRPAKR